MVNQTLHAFVNGQFLGSDPFVAEATEFAFMEFAALNIPNHRIYIDDFSITAVPEPGSVLLLGAGLAALGVAARSRQFIARHTQGSGTRDDRNADE